MQDISKEAAAQPLKDGKVLPVDDVQVKTTAKVAKFYKPGTVIPLHKEQAAKWVAEGKGVIVED